jgi:hypothetical protein
VLPTEGFQPTLTKLIDVLDRFEVRYHLTGGVTSVVYGEPRLTQDIDVVVDPERAAQVAARLLPALAVAGFEYSEETAARAIESGGMFQLLDTERVIKVDLYLRCLIPGELDRSIREELFPGVSVPIVSREDAALSKLIWIDQGSYRSRRDLRRIIAAASESEIARIRCVATEMGLGKLLDQVRDESDEPSS